MVVEWKPYKRRLEKEGIIAAAEVAKFNDILNSGLCCKNSVYAFSLLAGAEECLGRGKIVKKSNLARN